MQFLLFMFFAGSCLPGKRHRGRNYNGTISVTETGKVCQLWSSQIARKHNV